MSITRGSSNLFSDLNMKAPEVELTFDWITEKIGESAGHILLICVATSAENYSAVLQHCQESGLECLEKTGEYGSRLGVYVKKHVESDADYSAGFMKGNTVRECFQLVVQAIEKTGKVRIAHDAGEKLTKFKQIYSDEGGLDWETVTQIMPELVDFVQLQQELAKLSP